MKNEPYHLTVITVCLNVLKELQQTVESVKNQKNKGTIRIEHLIIDGSSHDGTPEWLKEQLAAGNIEGYISEPDRGIYDAMNKGITLAHGNVLAFLNAGDYYDADEDISCCVLPICKGETVSLCASAVIHHEKGKAHVYSAGVSMPFLNMVGSHQAFFASANAYKAVGGYDDEHFRSAGDFNMVNSMIRQFGLPRVVSKKIVHFVQGGFSSGSWTARRHEMIEIHHRSWPLIASRCKTDAAYRAAALVMFSAHVVTLAHWDRTKLAEHGETVSKLREMLAAFPAEELNTHQSPYLAWLNQAVMPDMVEKGYISFLKRYRLDIGHMRVAPTWQSRLSPILAPWAKKALKSILG